MFYVLMSVLLGLTSTYATTIFIDLSEQKLTVVDKNKVLLASEISTGNKYHPTPTGTFRVFKKERYHKSTLYPIHSPTKRGGAPMNYMLKFAPAIAIHEGMVVREEGHSVPVSHGCVRVPTKTAIKLFKIISLGTTVKVKGKASYANSFNSHLKKISKSEDVLYFEPAYDGESTLNLSISTMDIEEI